jgi:ribosomal protein L7/L12
MDSGELENHVRTMLAQNQPIEAIKWVRHQTGWGLKRSKDYVDEVARAMLPPLSAEEKTALDQEIGALVQRGARIEAIKRVRVVTGWGLTECKDYVDRLSSSAPTGEAVPVPPLARDPGPDLSQFIVSQVRALLAEGHKVRAVQLVRTVAGVGLHEAKEYVDSLEARGDLEDEEPIDEQEEHARLVKEARFLLTEQARLERERDRLLAVQGRLRTRPPRASKRGRIRRNAPCPCGSGIKYKNCCGRRR